MRKLHSVFSLSGYMPLDLPPRRKRVTHAILAAFSAISLISLILIVFSPSRENIALQAGQDLAEHALTLAHFLPQDTSDDVSLRAALLRLPVPPQTQIFVLHQNGHMITGNAVKDEDPISWVARPALLELFEKRDYDVYSTRANKEFVVARAPLANGSSLILSRSIEHVESLKSEDLIIIIRLAILLSLFALFVVYARMSNFNRPMHTIVSALKESQTSGQKPDLPDLDSDTQIGQLSKALQETLAALHDRIETNAQFAADVAHELKNPLASMQSAAQTLSRITDKAKQDRLIGIIQQDVRRMDLLISDISNASRLDSDLVRSHAETFDLRDVILPVIEHFTEEAELRDIALNASLPEEPVMLSGLPERLAQVVVNLVDNALSFTPNEGQLNIWLHRVEGRALFVVEDNGPGIPEQALEKVFTRFYSERPAADFGEHSGLGLAISKQIVEAHDGVIWAENIHPNGARFVMGLPL